MLDHYLPGNNENDMTFVTSLVGNVVGAVVDQNLDISKLAHTQVERLHGLHFDTLRQAKDEALDWLLWYNQTRLHSTLN